MFRENFERNSRIYELWKKGYTVKEISFETGIPRSSAGYYVRKFNKRARRGDPIPFLPEREKPDEKKMAIKAFIKNFTSNQIMQIIAAGVDIDKFHKTLMVIKLLKELQRDLTLTKEEKQALDKHWMETVTEIMDTMSLQSNNKTNKEIPINN